MAEWQQEGRPAHPLFEQAWPEGDYRFFQLGFVVDDLLDAAARWAAVFGVGPFHVLAPIEQAWTFRGTPSAVNIQVALAQAGPVQIELIKQHCDRPSPFREWSRRGVSSIHQLATVTHDYDGRKRLLQDRGYELTAEIDVEGYRVGYFDTSADFGFFTEVVASTQVLDQLGRISRACAEWDGTDPVRILTRDGYRVP
ncbi:MAG TPA: VOC family protein [Acidimicrobiia bacterium]|jgi:hypothetical protein|nr:VOC family protein [Acidimicrobiia bacterium]